MTLEQQLAALARLLEVETIKVRYLTHVGGQLVELHAWSHELEKDDCWGHGSTLSAAVAGAFARLAGRVASELKQQETELEILKARKHEVFALQSRAHNDARKKDGES